MDPTLALIIRIALAWLLGWAAWHKVRDIGAFRATLGEYRLLPKFLVAPIALLIIAIESLAALGLLVPQWVSAASLLGASVFMLYAAAMGINLLRGRRDIDCGCFGPAHQEPISITLVLRNALLAAIAVSCYWPFASRSLVWLDFITIAGGVLLVAALYLSANRLLMPANARTPVRAGE